MPIHDWTRVPAGLFHHFHQDWSIGIKDALNAGRLSKGFAALVEQSGHQASDTPAARRSREELYASRANRIVVKHHLRRNLAVIELISPGNKASPAALRDFVDSMIAFLRAGIHVLIVDLFPPTSRDPWGIHQLIWDAICEGDFKFPDGKDRLLVSYGTGNETVAYVDDVGVGDDLPDMPLFIADFHVMVPLEATYRATWDALPEEMRMAIETGVMPEPDAE